ncbi:MAG: ATP-dependent helicase [Mycobacterium sp.]|nr:ATP-dependent helicase [Mycobacterium sp.]
MSDAVDVRLAEIALEQEHVDRVYQRWEATRAQARSVEVEGNQRGRAGANPGALYERDVLAYHAARRMIALDSAHEGLVFGRLDLADGETRHVGRVGLRDEEYEPLVVDWRAPAAAPFYRATAEEPAGVVRRRVIRSSGPRVVGVEDDLLDPDAAPEGMPVVGEGALMASLSRSRDGSMHDIVATIQREQDLAIRAPETGVTLLSGGPGTGKTVVALHRAAYLLYANRRRFQAGGVLVVGPSPVFIDYIERVLPALGEDAASLRSLGGLVDDVETDRHDDAATAAVKGSLRMRTLLERAGRDTPPSAPDRLRLVYGGEVLELDRGELARIRSTVLSRGGGRGGHGGRVNPARRQAAEALLTALWGRARRRIPDRRLPERPDFDEELRDRTEFAEFLLAWWPVLTPAEVLGWAADRKRLERYAAGVLSAAEIELLAGSWARPGPSVQDVALLDELHHLLGDPPAPPVHRDRPEDDEYREVSTFADRAAAARRRPERTGPYDEYAHVIVDEAQDVSPMQWRMLGRRGPHASWTIVGDPMQSSWADRAEAAAARDEALNSRVRHEFRLTKNYRNPAEIFAVAAEVIRHDLPDADLPDAVRSTGVVPLHRVVPDLADAVAAAIASLRSEVEGLLAVVTPMDRVAEVRSWLPEDDSVRVVGSLDSKGMEYDGVVIVEPGDIVAESPSGVATLYVALTRATQRLVTVATDGSWLKRFGLTPTPTPR